MANGLFGGGDGTQLNPYLVEDMEDLSAIRNNMSAHYLQTKDIDLTLVENWNPIGGVAEFAFTGVFDGNNKKIKNFSIHSESGEGGLFSYLEGGKLLNITLTNVNMVTYDRAGSLVAYLRQGSEVTNCHMTGSVTHTRTGVYRIGGLIGYATGASIITDCTARGVVTAESQFGGLIGYIESGTQLIRCAAYSEVTSESGYGSATGILAGAVYTDCVMDNCYAEGLVQSQGTTAGLAGYNDGIIRNSMVKGVIDIKNWNGADYAEDFGGIAGYNSGTIENCLSLCSFKREGTSSRIGALVGNNNVGKDYEGTIISSYYGNYLEGVSDVENGVGTPLTEAQVKDTGSYVGWEFDLLWSIGEDGFPLPTFALPPKPEEPAPIPEIDFRQTEMLRDMFNYPIPQVWHVEQQKWVPVTNQSSPGGGAGGGNVDIGKATTEELGLVRFDGRTIISDEDGVLTAVIPIATAKLLGGIKPDEQTIFVDSETGVASAPRNVHTSNRSPLPEDGRDGDLWIKYKEVE